MKIIFKQTNSSSFYILNIGGFGHTITQAETYYEYLDNSGKVICIYTPKRHNPKIDILYPDRYYLINRSKFFWLIDPKRERALYEFSERVIIKFLTYLFNRFRRRTYIYNWDSIINTYDVVALGTKLLPRSEIIVNDATHGYFEEMLCAQSLFYHRHVIEHLITTVKEYSDKNSPFHKCAIDMFLNDCSSNTYRFIHNDRHKKFNFGITIPMIFTQKASFSDNEGKYKIMKITWNLRFGKV